MSSARPLPTSEGRLALRLLVVGGDTGLSVAEMRKEGLTMPAQALYEVELAGWPLERRAGRTRLRPADAPPPKPFEMPPSDRWADLLAPTGVIPASRFAWICRSR